jgi:hypothetical protein
LAAPNYDKITLREYRYQRLRWGATGGADYKLNDHSSLAAHFLLSDFKDWGDKWYYELKSGKSCDTAFYESTRRPDFSIGSFSLDGNHNIQQAVGALGIGGLPFARAQLRRQSRDRLGG